MSLKAITASKREREAAPEREWDCSMPSEPTREGLRLSSASSDDGRGRPAQQGYMTYICCTICVQLQIFRHACNNRDRHSPDAAARATGSLADWMMTQKEEEPALLVVQYKAQPKIIAVDSGQHRHGCMGYSTAVPVSGVHSAGGGAPMLDRLIQEGMRSMRRLLFAGTRPLRLLLAATRYRPCTCATGHRLTNKIV